MIGRFPSQRTSDAERVSLSHRGFPFVFPTAHAFDLLQDNDTSVLVELDMKFTPEQWEEIQRRYREDS